VKVDELIKELEKLRREHLVVEDCWYSCPASGECCDDRTQEECRCGADHHNTKLDALIARLKTGGVVP